MKKQQKQRHEFVDQFRKISTLQKLPKLTDQLKNIFEDDVQKDSNNFIRMRKEPIIERWDIPQNQQVLLSNECVEERVNNLLAQEQKGYQLEDFRVRGHINMFKEWSAVNKATSENKNQVYKFYYKNASPPKKIAEIASSTAPQNKRKQRERGIVDFKNQQDEKQSSEFDILNNIGNQKYQYDFKLINQKRLDDLIDKPDKQMNNQGEKEEDIFLLTFRKFQKYKNLQEINRIDQNKMAEQEFFYDLNNKNQNNLKLDKYLVEKFIYKSVAKQLKNTQKDVQYFRDIGLPSRNLDKYSESMTEQKPAQSNNPFLEQQTKQQAHFLHLLRQNQLNINKTQINFDDISNLSNSRITPLNAYMCIRSQKVTKAQFQKLIKKLDRYKKQEMEKGKQKVDKQIETEDIEMQNNNNRVNQKHVTQQQRNQISQLIQEISQIRQSALLVDGNMSNGHVGEERNGNGYRVELKQMNFKRQIFTRMQLLLKKLYEKIIINPAKYPFTFLEDYMDNIDEILLEEYKDGKLLWFILDCYEQIIQNLPNQDNIRTVMKRKPINQPKLTYYKGGKVVKQQKLKAKNLFTYKDKNLKNQAPTNDRSNVRTNNRSRTPTRQTTTPIKKSSTTPNKTVIKQGNFSNTNNFTRNKF